MAAGELGRLASEGLLERKEELARSITVALYAEMPELMARYGDWGRSRCLEDMRYNLEHLAPAVALGEPSLFAGYVTWLRDMLGSRGIPSHEVRRSLELTRDAARAALPEDEAEIVATVIAAGLGTLVEGGDS